ncbi:MAG: hypothetical protein ACRD16_13195 [Thermoanaerobaculia bacterium]
MLAEEVTSPLVPLPAGGEGMPKAGKRFGGLLLSLACGVAAAIFLSAATKGGIGISPDSVDYLSMASSDLKYGEFDVTGEDGFAESSIHRPVGYPASLALLGRVFSIDLRRAARLESIAFFGGTAGLLAVWVSTLIGGPVWLPIFSGALFFLTPDAAAVHAMAWSEPGFLFFGLLGLFFLALDSGRGRRRLLLAAGVSLGICFLYRQAGVVFVLVGTALVCLRGPRRLARASGVAAVALTPSALFYLRNKLMAGRATFAAFRIFPLHGSDGSDLVYRFREGLSPDARFFWPSALSLLLIVALGLNARRGSLPDRNADAAKKSSFLAISLLIAIYLIFLVSCKIFLFASIPFDARYLCPILPAGILLLAHGINRAEPPERSWVIAGGVSLLAGVLLLARCSPARRWIQKNQTDSPGYAQIRWEKSGVVAAARTLAEHEPPGTIFSNSPDLLEFQTGKRFASLPSRADVFSGLSDQRYPAELRNLSSLVRRGRAFVIYVGPIDWRTNLPNSEGLRRVIGDRYCYNLEDGMVCGLLARGGSR